MSLAGHSTLREHSLLLQGLLNVVPDPRIRIVHRKQQLGLLRDIAQVIHQLGTSRACFQMLFLFRFAARLYNVRQYFLELLAIHCFHPLPPNFAGTITATFSSTQDFRRVIVPAVTLFNPGFRRAYSRQQVTQIAPWISLPTQPASTYLRAAFSALLSFNKSRSFMRALCSCDLLFPIEHPIISAISLCS